MNVEPFYQKYPREKVDAAMELLNYKKTSPMPHEESDTEPTLYVFRHGQTEDNADYIFSGWRDSPLTEKGRGQAEVLAEKLRDKRINVLISSPQRRALDTMKIAISLNRRCKNMEIQIEPRIRERSYGNLQGQSKLEMQLENPTLLQEYRRSYTKKIIGGESLEEVVKRVEGFCSELVPLIKEHRINVAISCHGNSIRGFRKFFENLSVEEICDLETPLAQDYLSYVIS